MSIRRNVHKSTFRKIFALACTLFLIAAVLIINRPTSAAVTVTPGANFQIDITGAESVSVDCFGGFVRVAVDAVPSVTLTPCNTVTSLRATAIGNFDNSISLSGVAAADFSALVSVDVDGGAGNDAITGSERGDHLRGGLGDDSVFGSGGDDQIFGNDGNDILRGGPGIDRLYGGDGNDIFGNPSAVANGIADDSGNDQFFGESGSDTFFWEPGDGDDLVEGGAGDSDQIQFFGNAGAEQFFVFADLTVQSRLHIFRVQASIDIDASDIEEVNLTSAGGTDNVTIGRSDTGPLSDLSTTGVRLVNVLLGDDTAADSIIVEGRPVNDNVLVSLPAAGNLDLVRMAGLSYDVIFAGLDSPVIDRITVNGNDGNDEIKAVDGVEAAVNITLNGGAGNDVLSADAILSGGDGNDTLKGGTGNDSMDGGNGDDVLVFTAGNDTMIGGPGFDTLRVEGNDAANTISLSQAGTIVTISTGLASGTVDLTGVVSLERLDVFGFAGNDSITLTGLTLATVVDAGAGNDSVDGLAMTASFIALGGAGDDGLSGGSASDRLEGGEGFDRLDGGNGSNTLLGGPEGDTLTTRGGTDNVDGGTGDDAINFANGNGDYVVFRDFALGHAGISGPGPSLARLSDVETINLAALATTGTYLVHDLGGSGVVRVNVNAQGFFNFASLNFLVGALTVEGTGGDDNIQVTTAPEFGSNVQKVFLGWGQVVFNDNDGTESLAIRGLAGNDTIKVDGTAAIVTRMTLAGDAGNDRLEGGATNDTLDGGAGDDVLVFSAGNDTMTGGTGFDALSVYGDDAANTMTVSQAGTVLTIANGLINGTADLTGALSVERLDVFGFAGNDNITVSGVSLPKTIDAGAGNDTVDLSAAVDATIIGGAGDDSLTGSPAADTIDGGSGNDTLLGLAGVDVLIGGDGNDTLTGGTGGDQMFGGADSDILIWNNGDGSDLMEGDTGTDAVQVNGSNAGDAFLITPNGARVRFDRTNLGLFNLDIGSAEELTVNGLDGDDTFSATPLAETHITLNGANPVPPVAPGDQLNIDFTGSINSIKTPLGVGAGIWSFNNRQSINFTGIETQGPAGPDITINNVAIIEGNSGSSSAIFTATLSAASAQTVSVDVTTANGTATASGDYQSSNATLTFLPGVTTANFSVPINGDTTPEGNETLFVNLTNAVNANITTAQGTGTINDDDSTNIFQFSSATGNVNENAVPGSATVTVTRTGDLTGAASVQFETNDGTGKQKTDYTFGFGTVQFGPGEGSRDVKILIVNDVSIEGAEAFQVSLSNPSGNSAIGSPGTIIVTINDDDVAVTPNPIDDAGFFVRQHYLDFFGREPDAPGLAFWNGQITACGGNAGCIEATRVHVSASFFLSIEFQETGGYALRLQRSAFGRQSNDPFTRYPYLPFMRDARTIGQGVIIGEPGANALLEQNKQAYADQIVASAEFAVRFPAAPAAVYVDALFASAGVVPTVAERTAAINAFGAGGNIGRVAALRSVTDSASVRAADFRVAFVLAEFFGYLRRNPTDAPDFNNAGYQFWLDKLKVFNGNFIEAEMVKAFIASIEYRQRFGP